MKEKLNMPEMQEAQTKFHLCKQLFEAAEACEVSEKLSLPIIVFGRFFNDQRS